MIKKITKIIRNIIAVVFFIIGIIGGFIPILQGWVFVLIGFILLDFKKKHEVEEKFLQCLNRFGWGRKLVNLWLKVKRSNKKLIDSDNKQKITDIYRHINKKDERKIT